MANEREFGILLEKLNSGDSGDKECASLLQRLVDMQPATPEPTPKSIARSISLVNAEVKVVMLRLMELLPNNIDPTMVELFKTKLSEG